MMRTRRWSRLACFCFWLGCVLPCAGFTLQLVDGDGYPLSPFGPTVLEGAAVTLVAKVSDEGEATFAWYKNGALIPGASTNRFTIPAMTAADVAAYWATARRGDVVVSAYPTRVNLQLGTVPVIIDHPVSLIHVPGSDGYLHVYARAKGAVSYHWRRNGQLISAPNEQYLALDRLPASSIAGTYTVTVRTSAGEVTSEPAVVELAADRAPSLYSPQESLTLFLGEVLDLRVFSAGSPQPQLQWMKNGVAIAGATGYSYRVNPVTAAAAGAYTVVASNRAGSITSPVVNVGVVTGPPIIQHHPRSHTAIEGNVSLQVVALGAGPLTYQWLKDGQPIAGANSSYLDVSEAGTYAARVSATHGTTTSENAVVTLRSGAVRPLILNFSGSAAWVAPSRPLFFVQPSGLGKVSWFRDGVALPGVTTDHVDAGEPGIYVAEVSEGTRTERTAPIHSRWYYDEGPPILRAHPRSVTTGAGNPVYLYASAMGSRPLSYQWHYKGQAIPGATTDRWTIASVSASTAGDYRVTVSNALGQVTSDVATVAIASAPANQPPLILRHPRSNSDDYPRWVSLEIVVEDFGAGGSIRWLRNGSPVAGANSIFYSFYADQPSVEYVAEVTTASGSVRSRPAVVRVLPPRPPDDPPFVAKTYFDHAGYVGQNLSVWSSATGSGPITYRWYHNGQLVPGATGTELKLNPLKATSAGWYVQVATSPYGVVVSDPVFVRVIETPRVAAVTERGEGPVYVGDHVQLQPVWGELKGSDLSWRKGDRTVAPNADGSISLSNAQLQDAGRYELWYRNSDGAWRQIVFDLVVLDPAAARPDRIINLSTRLRVPASSPIIMGFVIGGTGAKPLLIRAVGPTLRLHKVPDFLPNPRLRLYQDRNEINGNDDWPSHQQELLTSVAVQIGAFPMEDNSVDAGLWCELQPGAYTVHVSASNQQGGIALVELYDLQPGERASSRLINVSTRGQVGRDADILIVGFVVVGDQPKQVLIRGVGPTLARYEVTGTLADPRLQLFRGEDQLHASDDWWEEDREARASAAAAVGAFPLDANSKDAALLVWLEPGAYTAHLSGANGGVGEGMVEVYEIP
jgi:hypothetical protein